MLRRARRVSRREFLKVSGISLAGATLLGVSGCGGGGEEGGGGDGEEIVFSWISDDTGVLPELIDEFNEENESGLRVRFREMPSDTGQHFDQLRTEFQAGQSEIDVIGGDVIWPSQFARSEWIVDLSDRFGDQEEFLEGPMQAMRYEGKVYGVPWYTDSGLLYYRQDLLEEAGFSEPPDTWEELQEMARKVTQDAGIQQGFVFQGGEYEGGVVNGLEYIWNAGGNVLEGDRIVIDSPESVQGLRTERAMIETGTAPEAVISYKEDESHAAFIRGDSVFLRNWPYVYSLLGSEGESNVEPEQVGVAPLPVEAEGNQSYSGLGGWNFFISALSEKQDQAWEFIQFITAPEQQKTNALDGSRLPTRTSLYEDQEILDSVPIARLGKETIIENTRPRPVSPYYSDMSLTMAEQFAASLRGSVSPEEAVSNLQRELENIAERGGEI